MNKEKILLVIVTKDGSSLAVASLIPKIRASISNFPSTSNHSMVTSELVTIKVFSLYSLRPLIYAPNQKRLAVVAFTLFYPLLL